MNAKCIYCSDTDDAPCKHCSKIEDTQTDLDKFLIDKYRPKTKEDAHFHKNILDMLEIMSKDEAIPHIIFYGPSGSGKKTLVNIFLGMLFGDFVYKTKDASYEITSSGGKKTTELVKQSNYHIIINPKSTNYDRYLIHDIVKEYAKSKTLNTIFEKNKQFKLVLMNNLDNLSFSAQAALRKTMERYNDKCRFVMVCKSLSKVIDPLQSRCVCIRIPSPQDLEIFQYILKIGIKEDIELTLDDYCNIIKKANGNIKRALWGVQFKKYVFELYTEYDNSIEKIIELLFEKNLYNVWKIKQIFFNLTITNYTGINILKELVNKLIESTEITKKTKQQIVQTSSEIDYRFLKGRREIIHFDLFIERCIKHLMDN